MFPDSTKPLRLEVCSGTGDWIVERAEKDPDSNWVRILVISNNFQIGLEMRNERVFQTWSKAMFNAIPNIVLLVLYQFLYV
jgi:tRNA G46 methylase TrmB